MAGELKQQPNVQRLALAKAKSAFSELLDRWAREKNWGDCGLIVSFENGEIRTARATTAQIFK